MTKSERGWETSSVCPERVDADRYRQTQRAHVNADCDEQSAATARRCDTEPMCDEMVRHARAAAPEVDRKVGALPRSNADRVGGRRITARRADANRTDMRVEHLDARPSAEGAARCADVDERHVEIVVEGAGGSEPHLVNGEVMRLAMPPRGVGWRCNQGQSRDQDRPDASRSEARHQAAPSNTLPRAAERPCVHVIHTGNPPPGPVPWPGSENPSRASGRREPSTGFARRDGTSWPAPTASPSPHRRSPIHQDAGILPPQAERRDKCESIEGA